VKKYFRVSLKIFIATFFPLVMQNYFSNNKKIKKLFNLGLHLHNKLNIHFTDTPAYTRSGNKALIQNPVLLTIQLIGFIKMFRRLLQNNETIVLVNTHAMYRGYAETFEGTNIKCYEEP
jgi:hypothetical protein